MNWSAMDLSVQSLLAARTNVRVLGDRFTLANLFITRPNSVTAGQRAQYIPTASESSWVFIYPGTNIQNLVDSYPATTTFYLQAGTHVQQQVVPKSGNTFIGQAGAVMDGESVTPFAFYSNNLGQSNVTIRSLEIKRYATPLADFGAITGENVTDWQVLDNVVHSNAQAGIRVGTGAGWRVSGNVVYNNGVVGVSGYRCDGAVIENNESYGNNPSASDTGREAGIKIFEAANLTIRGNYVHNNNGKGIWSDTNYPIVLIETNIVTDNSGTGIYHEISYEAIIRNNTASRNGNGLLETSGSLTRAGIQVTNSSNVEVYGNIVIDNHNGISGLYFTGYPSSGPYGPYILKNLYVHDNSVTMHEGKTGIAQNAGETAIYTRYNNHFEHNTYHLGPNAIYFTWIEQNLTEQQWRATGNDVTATFTRY